MKTELDILRDVSERLDSAGIAFMVTGSVADFQIRIVSFEDRFISTCSGSEMNDTPNEISELVRRKLLELSGSERVLIGSRMFDSARAISLSSLPSGISELEIKRQLCTRLYGSEVDVAGFIASLKDR